MQIKMRMKNTHVFPILVCMLSLFLMTSCDKTELQKSSKEDLKVTTRTDDCDDCPVGDCCCRIVYTSGPGVVLQMCGTTGSRLSTEQCGPINDPPSPCPAIGTSYILGPFTISSGSTSQYFCVPTNAAFMIGAISGSTSVSITCQSGQTNPQTINTTLTSANRYYFETDGECGLSGCP